MSSLNTDHRPPHMHRTQFTFYESFYKAAKRIQDPLARAQVYDAICDYALYGIAPDMDSLADVAAIAFELIKPNLDASRKKAEAGRVGGSRKQNRSTCEANRKQGKHQSKKETETENKNKNKNKNEKEDEKESYMGAGHHQPSPCFVPPTVEEVSNYCKERGNSIDPQHFIDYYCANGWVQGRGGKPIKDWRAAVRTWERSGIQSSPATPKSITPGQDFQPEPERIQKNAVWLDQFLAEQAATG